MSGGEVCEAAVPRNYKMSEAESEAARAARRACRIQRQLDEALAATFPASDPVSIVTSEDEEDWDTDGPPSEVPPKPAAGPAPRAD